MTDDGYKKFSQQLYDENDEPAAAALKSLFMGTEFTVRRHANKYTVDFEVLRDGNVVAYLEVEVKHGWEADTYPFSDVRFPKRKCKFTKLDKPTYFVMFNKGLNRHLMVSRKTLMNAPQVRIDTKYTKNEAFYAVPLTDVKWDRFKNLPKT